MRPNEGLEALGTDDYGCGVFWGSSVESVILPSTLRRIKDSTFYGCKNLRSIKLPDNLGYIGQMCFQYSGLTEVQIPKSCIEVKNSAFYHCPVENRVAFHDGKVFLKD